MATGDPAGPVGLVVVSHSRALARAAVALAQEMLHGRRVGIEVAAGLDDTTFGTDAEQIMEAITAADHGAGVVVLMDLGSAVLSAELALELLDDAIRERVVLCPAPLVEGLIVAAVAAAGGAGRDEVAAEAAASLAGKTSHLGPVRSAAGGTDDPGDTAGPGDLTGAFIVTNPHGLHARPAARVVQAVRMLDARVALRNRTTSSAWVPGSSLSKVATLGALCGHEVEVRVSGSQAREALEHVVLLAARGFDEAPGSGGAIRPQRVSTEAGRADPHAPIAASAGVGIGPAWSLHAAPIEVADARADDPAAEWRRLKEAIAAVRRDVQRVRARAVREVGEAEAAIFDAHLLLLDDADLLGDVRLRVDGGQAAAPAWSARGPPGGRGAGRHPGPVPAGPSGRCDRGRRPGTPRPAGSVGRRRRAHRGAGDRRPHTVRSRRAGQLARRGRRPGIRQPHRAQHRSCCAPGASLRSSGRAPGVLGIVDGTLLAVDGTRGEIVADPPEDVQAAFRARAAELVRGERQALAHARSPALTRDGVAVLVGANVGAVDDAVVAATCGADLAGLVRTEFLFMGRAEAPDVEEQEVDLPRHRHRAGRGAADHPAHPRRRRGQAARLPADATEANPFLGVRGIRLSMVRPELLADQLLAIVRVAHDVPVSLMFPMISTLDELLWARRMLDDAIKLAGRGEPADLQVGIMVEVPAAALKARAFAPHVDFFSIGTNDLTQYALAAERGNDAVARVGDPFDPGVLHLVDAVCRSGKPVAVCGELAADERATPLLIGLGVRELSVAPRAASRRSSRQFATTTVATPPDSRPHRSGRKRGRGARAPRCSPGRSITGLTYLLIHA